MNKLLAEKSRAMLWTAVIALSLAVGLFASLNNAGASHYRYMADDPSFNPSPGNWTYAVNKWSIGNGAHPAATQAISWCNSLGGYSSEVSTAFSDWETAISAWTQFTSASCATADLKVVWGSCSPGVWACMVYSWNYDATRLGNYPTGGEIRLVSSATTWDSTRVVEVVRHEAGHFMGLNEHYLHTSPITCNPSAPNTVMDNAPGTIFGCGDGSTVTSADSTDVTSEYTMSTVASLVGWNCSAYYGGSRTFCVNWYDNESTNSEVYIDYWRCSDATCSMGSTYVGSQWNTTGAGLYGANNSTSFGPLAGPFYYWAGVSNYSAGGSYGPTTYTGITYLP